ncbi:MAG TPA: DUF2795 domain-containing protein [Pseudorhizobium sp.]|jgi:hypothetical protein|nr:DUF2795 domain-containing protein [Pseudorhizobium sp.]
MANEGRGGGHSPANVTKHLSGIDFPAGKNDLIKHAEKGDSDGDAIEMIKKMPDRTYESMADVMKGFGEVE